MNQYLGYVNTSGNMSVQRLSAIFGVYGELPLVAVRLDDCFVLMDPLAGNLSGPFAPDSVLDARGLLSAYEGNGVYAQGSGIRYLTSQGCPTTVAAGWVPLPGPGIVIPPAWTRSPSSPPTFPIPGRPTNWTCTQDANPPAGTGDCICSMQETFTGFVPWPTFAPAVSPPPAGTPAVTVRTTCNYPGGCAGAGTPGSLPPGNSGPSGGLPVLPVTSPGTLAPHMQA